MDILPASPAADLRPGEILQEVNEHIRLIQRTDGLTFGTDAYLLSAYVRPRPRARAVDLGSGTGIIPLLCLSRGKVAQITAVELQPPFCELIERNAALNGVADRLTPLCADVRTLTTADVGGEVELVTANPPYLPLGSGAGNRADEKHIARHETAGGIGDFCAAAGRILKHGGRFCCVFRPERLADLFTALRDAHLEPKRLTTVQATPAAPPSLLLVEAVKYGAPGLLYTPPLCLCLPDAEDPTRPATPAVQSSDAAYVYGHCAFPSRFTGENRTPPRARENTNDK